VPSQATSTDVPSHVRSTRDINRNDKAPPRLPGGGLASVPVYVLPATVADASQETIDRIVHQIVTNDQKQDLTDAQRARGIQQMIDAGMSAAKVAKIVARQGHHQGRRDRR